MFAKLTGKIDTLMLDSLILDVGGVGYHVFASRRTLGSIGDHGDPVSLLIDTHVREDHIHLYGFASRDEREWFRILTGVQGVGARSGLAILSVADPQKLVLAIASNDVAVFRQAEGVGPKLATRIVSELKDKVKDLNLGYVPATEQLKSKKAETVVPADMSIDHDAVSALVNLGYGRSDAFSAVMTVRQRDGELTVENLIRLALKELAS